MSTETLDRAPEEVRRDIRGWIRCVRSARKDDICAAAEYSHRVRLVWKYRNTGWSHAR